MRTENNETRIEELDQMVEQLLTPRFAPSADGVQLQTKPRTSKRTLLINLARIGGVAAALIVGIFALVGPTNKVRAMSAEELITHALEELQNSNSIKAEFKAKIVKSNSKDKTEIYRLAPNGEDITGVLTLIKDNNKVSFRIEWSNGRVQLFDSYEMRYKMWDNGELVCDEPRTSINAKFMRLLSLDGVKQEFGSDSEIQIKEQGDEIVMSHTANNTEVVGAFFSPKEGRLQEVGVRCKDSSGKWVKVLSAKIDYSTPISKEQITASPKR